MKNIIKFISYYKAFAAVVVVYAILWGIKLYLKHPENFTDINITETSKQYVLIMGSLAGFSLLIMGFLMFEISTSDLKKIDIDIFSHQGHDNKKVADKLLKKIEEDNFTRKETVTVFLTCLIINLFGAIIAAIGSDQEPGTSVRALSAFLPSSAFMILSCMFILIGIGRIIDVFKIEFAKRFFCNLVFTIMLFGLIEFAGSIDDATTLPTHQNMICGPQIIAIISALAAGIPVALALHKRRFNERQFPRFSFIAIIVGVAIVLYEELFVEEEFRVNENTSAITGYVILIGFSALIGASFAYLIFDEGVFPHIDNHAKRRFKKAI